MTLDFTLERRLELQREEATEEGRELKLQEPLEVILPLCDQIEKELHSTT